MLSSYSMNTPSWMIFLGSVVVINLLTQATAASSVCTGAFDVHTDKIIRTEESTAMGAQFVDETELSTREQCLELCCETIRCDVFVYEEKTPGSCYLFHCGPPDDFRCKFSKHANYSSAVLTTPRQQLKQEVQRQLMAEAAQQASQRHISQHEQELANLRSRIVSASGKLHVTTKASIDETPIVPTTSLPKVMPAASIASQRCSEYQFSCHSGECIAVYNACDGIPQCIDGSDEAAELRCPPLPTPVAQNSPAQQTQPNVQKPIMPVVPYDKPLGNVYAPGETNIPVINELQEGHIARSNWIPHASNEHAYETEGKSLSHQNGFQSIVSQYSEPQSEKMRQAVVYHEPFRNHPNGGGVAVWQLERLQQNQVGQQNPWLTRQQPVIIPSLRDMPKQTQQGNQWDQDWDSQNVQRPVQQDIEAEIISKQESHLLSNSDVSENNHVESKHITNKHQNKEENNDQIKKLIKQNQQKSIGQNHELEEKESVQYARWADEIDGEAERPGGAVLSLTLGVCITAALAILVGCRLRLVKRRTRRHGKSSHAHDPDYLVNGMYL